MKRRVIGAAVAVVLLAGLVAVLLPHGGTRDGTAYFTRAVGLYKGSDVRVLGVRIGEVRTVTAQGDRVRVDFVYDDKYKVPVNAKAVVIAASVVSDRYVQLHPGLYRWSRAWPTGEKSRSSARPCPSSSTGSSPVSTTSTSR